MIDWGTIAATLDELAADGTVRSRGAPATEEAVRAVEATLAVALPEAYRAFVIAVGDGGPGPDHGLMTLAESVADPIARRAAEPFVPLSGLEAPLGWDAPGLLPITRGGCSIVQAIVTTGPLVGTMWEYVEAPPGWIPSVLEDDGSARVGTRHGDLDDEYVDRLALAARGRAAGFVAWYRAWLDEAIRGRGGRGAR